ncbi:MAG: M48 family metalloprotease [Synergistaceae bacterium]|nr:M48 family metalloprotease [Synergistaceae bacterium]
MLGALSFVTVFTGAAIAVPVAVSPDVRSSDITSQEEKLAREGVKEIERQMRVLADPTLTARVQTIASRLKPFMDRDLPYVAKVIDHKMINAFALAGGPIYVSRSMIDFVKSDLELAGVIAHEMAHADKKHVMIQMARNERMTLIAIAAMIASKGHAAGIIAASALQVAVMGAYSVDIETEADAHGIRALLKAGYNPIGVLTLQERLLEEGLKRAYVDPGIYRTHPEEKERISAAVKFMEDNGIPINRKYALGTLRTGVEVISGDACLMIGDEAVWRGPDDEATLDLFSQAARALWDHLQMETAPYDIRFERGSGALYIESEKIVGGRDLTSGTEPLESLRDGILRALDKARRLHPMADYYLR